VATASKPSSSSSLFPFNQKKPQKLHKKESTTRRSSIILCRRAQILCVVLKFIEEWKTVGKKAMTRASEQASELAFLSFVCLFVAHFCFPCIFGVLLPIF
jgi:hypothetical protein